MSSAQAGFQAEIQLSTDGGSTFATIAEQAEVELTVDGESIDVPNFDSGGVIERIPGMWGWSMSAGGNMVDGGAQQEAVFDNITSNSKVHIRIRPIALTGNRQYEGALVLTQWQVSADTDGQAEFSMEGDGDGALTKTTQ